MLSLIQRGLIPHHAKITFEQYPVTTRTIRPGLKQKESSFTYKDNKTAQDHLYKLDPNYNPNNKPRKKQDIPSELNELKKLKSAKSKTESASNRSRNLTSRSIKEPENHPLVI